MADNAAASNAHPMPHLHLVPAAADVSAAADERPRVSLRLLMAASGRCSCDDCLIAYRRGNTTAGVVRVQNTVDRLIAVR
jgi:hypothetical protein